MSELSDIAERLEDSYSVERVSRNRGNIRVYMKDGDVDEWEVFKDGDEINVVERDNGGKVGGVTLHTVDEVVSHILAI